MKSVIRFTILMTALFAMLLPVPVKADQEPKTIESGECADIEFNNIPVGDFNSPAQMPEEKMRITQTYNNKLEEGSDAYCLILGGYASWDSEACEGQKLYYGHDGIDLHELGAGEGQNSVFSAQDGVVVVSHQTGTKTGWGETIIVAARAGEFSDEILTYHYHHLHQTGKVDKEDYATTRRFNACEAVARGEELAKEGTSGTTAVHLHLSVRRWKNIKALKDALKDDGKKIYGYGYTYGDDSKIAGHLDPFGILYDTFTDFTAEDGENIPYDWAKGACLDMRHDGIEFGLWNGEFGAAEPVKRREAARWLKTACAQDGYVPASATFSDVPLADSDSPAIEAMGRYPSLMSVVNRYATCKKGSKKFCPDTNLKRAEALKMVVLAFYADNFLAVYNNEIWKSAYAAAMALLSVFSDVDALSWFAPYVYFGKAMGVVAEKANFRPNDDITRAELAKWITLGISYHDKQKSNACGKVVCPKGHFCDPADGACWLVSQCVPSEAKVCEVGGGYEPEENTGGAGGTGGDGGGGNSGGNGGTGGTGGTGGNGGSSSGSTGGSGGTGGTGGSGGSGGSQQNGNCTAQQTSCYGDCCDNATEKCFMSACYCDGSKHYWNCGDGICRNVKTDSKNCGGCGNVCSDGKTCQDGHCVPDGSGGSGGNGGSSGSGGTGGTGGTGGSGGSGGNQSCQDTYSASSLTACFNNPQGTGTPTLCIEVQQLLGKNWQYRACKQGSPFANQFTYQLRDSNNLVNFSTYNSSSGVSCTPWQAFAVGYIGYGVQNGAGVTAEIISPSDCSQQSCKYKTGSLTISKACL